MYVERAGSLTRSSHHKLLATSVQTVSAPLTYVCMPDLSEEVLACQRDLGEVLRQVVVGEGVHLDLAGPADGHANASYGLGLRALHRQGDELKTQDLHALCGYRQRQTRLVVVVMPKGCSRQQKGVSILLWTNNMF